MASKGPRSKLDHDTRAKRQKALEAPSEPRRRKTHWDHVLEEMVWLSKDFESERKFKLGLAKRVAVKASKLFLDQPTRGEKKVKEEEQRLRKVALSISKDVKKFWAKIEKLVVYKHQLELDEKKKKTLDKQLNFLLGQTERYSTMLAENLQDVPCPHKSTCPDFAEERLSIQDKDVNKDNMDVDHDYDILSGDESEDNERTIEEDEALFTEMERQEELRALQNEMDLPLDELLKCYNMGNVSREGSPQEIPEPSPVMDQIRGKESHPSRSSERSCDDHSEHQSNGDISILDNGFLAVETNPTKNQLEDSKISKKQHVLDFRDEQEDNDYIAAAGEEKDDETTLLEEEELTKAEGDGPLNEIELLQKESEMSIEELLARYKQDLNSDEDADKEVEYASSSSEDLLGSPAHDGMEQKTQDSPISEGTVEEKEKIVEPEITSDKENENDNRIADAAAAARLAQPTGNTFSTTKVRTKFPFLLKHSLREYQHIGLDWLVTMYEKRLNGILADEMGLGKTIMTISLLAHLACEKGIWGPHLIVVPTSVMLNWETEFLKWCPAFKILTYYGSAKERKLKRQGWMKPNSFHVCITTYRLVIQDSKAFKRKKWKYLILDEAHLIKNWKSQRWQTLLNFNSKRRILLTGTPLQNDLMELWSLMHFLMPHIFQSHQEFKDWFSNPISGMVEGQEKVNKEVIDRLHNVLRPFILRRLKRDVEKQLPGKFEHVINCRLSRRQRNLYEDFIASSETQATLASSNFFGMISVIMQLRKVCNHPDLFEGRPIKSSFDMSGIDMQISSSICMIPFSGPFSSVDLKGLGFLFTHLDFSMTSWETNEIKTIATPSNLIEEYASLDILEKNEILTGRRPNNIRKKTYGTDIFGEIQKALWKERLKEAKERAASIAWWNSLQCRKKPIYGTDLKELVRVRHPVFDIHHQKSNPSCYLTFSSKLSDIVLSPVEHFQRLIKLVECFMFAIPAARAPSPVCWCSKSGAPVFLPPKYLTKCSKFLAPLLSPIRPAIVRRQVYFPDRRLIQFDCGKLQKLAILLRRLKSEGHRALIFTQMTKMLDILEAFINLYGYTYMRLDGSTQPEERQTLMQRFNTNPKIFLFILSTRSGGVGINLVGADTVIFYDSDWNPAMDQQAQDRCHRIGQTREVHIYRLISESTIEENILKKANQKRALDVLVIQSGSYNTEFFKKLDPVELFSDHSTPLIKNLQKERNPNNGMGVLFSNVDVEAALKDAEDEADYMALKRVEEEEAVDNQEFTDEAIGRLEDDEFVNEDHLAKCDEHEDISTSPVTESDPKEERALTLVGKEEDADMIADVQKMAAVGQANSFFENHLRPIDRYAMRFLDLWDPVVDKSAIESQVHFEETEWELDRIEQLKEDMEAEIDDDEEPSIYERWDVDVATEAYREEVKALAERQLMEELESEAKEAEEAEKRNCESRNEASTETKRKPKKKVKKKKFKSLKKEALASGSEIPREESSMEPMMIDDDHIFPEDISHSPGQRKRKRKIIQTYPAVDEEKVGNKKSKKLKRSLMERESHRNIDVEQNGSDEVMETQEIVVIDLDQKPVSRSKMRGKMSITAMPIKRVLVIKPEKLKKKGNIWSRACNDLWTSHEDAILCAIVHEYGTQWSFVSDALYGVCGGGFYRGRIRHPVHCCERFRELFQRYVVSSSTDNPNNEKVSNAGPGKAVFKVTEESIKTLLDITSDLPDNELLIQKHFTAVLSSVWKKKSRLDHWQTLPSTSQNGFDLSGLFSGSTPYQNSKKLAREPLVKMNLTLSEGHHGNLVAAALHDAERKQDNPVVLSRRRDEVISTVEQLKITLEFQTENEDLGIPFPSAINLLIEGTPDPEFSCLIDEKCFRFDSKACLIGENSDLAASGSLRRESIKSRPTSSKQSLGKHKNSISDSIKSSKSKLLRTPTTVPTEEQHPNFKLTSTSPPSNMFNFCSNINDNLISDTENLEMIPHEYDPSVISGLEDCNLFPDLTDIG